MAILISEDFEDSGYQDWPTGYWVAECCNNPGWAHHTLDTSIVKGGASSLRCDFPQGEHYGMAMTYDPVEAGAASSEVQEMSTSYWVRFSSDFNPDQGDVSKLPGAANTEGGEGKGCNPTTGDSGWSCRVGFRGGPDTVYLRDYTYHMDQPGSCGDHLGVDKQITRGEWHRVEQYVKLNTITNGSADSNGILRLWVDGELITDETSIRFNENPDLGCNYKYQVRYGGSDPSPKMQSVWLDGMLIGEGTDALIDRGLESFINLGGENTIEFME